MKNRFYLFFLLLLCSIPLQAQYYRSVLSAPPHSLDSLISQFVNITKKTLSTAHYSVQLPIVTVHNRLSTAYCKLPNALFFGEF